MDTLVLNTNFEPLQVCSWRRAMTLWVAGRVEVEEHYEDRVIRTSTRTFKVPAVVRFISALTNFNRDKGVQFNRKNVWLRDEGLCQYCAEEVPYSEMTFDHVVPKERGGRKTWKNIVCACIECNQEKANRTPEDAGMPLLNEPRKPSFLPQGKNPTEMLRDRHRTWTKFFVSR